MMFDASSPSRDFDNAQPEIPTPGRVNGGSEDLVNDNGTKKNPKLKKKRSAGPFGFFRAALGALRSTEKKKKPALFKVASESQIAAMDKEGDGNWKNFVGSMRPFHLQQGMQSPYHPHSHDQFDPFNFPSPSPSYASSSGTMSQYASATNLVALVDEHESFDQDPDEVFDAITGDDMIDSKAEEFIAQFYNQVKIDSHHYRSKTSQF